MRFIFLLLLLAACQPETRPDAFTAAQQTCAGYGYAQGSEGFRLCVMQVHQNYLQVDEGRRAAAVQYYLNSRR